MEKSPFIIKLIAVFYFAISLFFFLTGILFTNMLFYFMSLMTGLSKAPVSEMVLINSIEISQFLADSSYPILSHLLNSNIVSLGILALLASGIFFIIVIGLLRQEKWAKLFVILFSSFEILIGVFFIFNLYIVAGAIHILFHGLIVGYLVFNFEKD
jgi:hypothetical protein